MTLLGMQSVFIRVHQRQRGPKREVLRLGRGMVCRVLAQDDIFRVHPRASAAKKFLMLHARDASGLKSLSMTPYGRQSLRGGSACAVRHARRNAEWPDANC